MFYCCVCVITSVYFEITLKHSVRTGMSLLKLFLEKLLEISETVKICSCFFFLLPEVSSVSLLLFCFVFPSLHQRQQRSPTNHTMSFDVKTGTKRSVIFYFILFLPFSPHALQIPAAIKVSRRRRFCGGLKEKMGCLLTSVWTTFCCV